MYFLLHASWWWGMTFPLFMLCVGIIFCYCSLNLDCFYLSSMLNPFGFFVCLFFVICTLVPPLVVIMYQWCIFLIVTFYWPFRSWRAESWCYEQLIHPYWWHGSKWWSMKFPCSQCSLWYDNVILISWEQDIYLW